MDVEQRHHQTIMRSHDPRVADPRPLRVQRLLTELRAACNARLEPTLLQSLDALDQSLYREAERCRSHLEQQRCFDSRTMVTRQRAVFVRSVLEHLAESFARLGEPAAHAGASAAPPSLTLLDRNEHELMAALEQLAARGEACNGLVLTELSYRMAVLVGAPPLEGAALPSAPQNLAGALRGAIQVLDLPAEHQLLLVQAFEQKLLPALAALYEAANARLLADGILSHLRAFAGARPANPPSAPAPIRTRPAGVTSSATPAAPPTAAPEPIAVLETLRDLLSHQRAGHAHASGSPATPAELEIALGALQRHLGQITDRASRELRSAQRLREELLLHLNAGKPADAPRTRLSPEQDDTVELVACLFEQLGQQLDHGPHVSALLGELQLPILRVAMADRNFFEREEHPARGLLGTLAEAAGDWRDGSDIDADLAAQLSRLVARAQREPPSTGLFTSLLADIRHHLAQLSRKAQVNERRQVEAMQGRERLHQARQRAAEVLAARFAESTPRGLLRALLDRAWSDVLALALLRHGEQSEAFAERLRLTDQLLGRLPAEDPAALRLAVEDHLQQIGMQGEEAEQVARRLLGSGSAAGMPASGPVATMPAPASPADIMDPAGAAVAEAPSTTDLALRLKQRQRLGEQRGEQATSPHAAATAPLGPQAARIHDRLRQLPFGAWFEFTDAASGACTRGKLAWYSPLSGNSLFVNRRGQRIDGMHLRELATALAEGRVRELSAPRDGLLDRAWRALTGSLQRPQVRP